MTSNPRKGLLLATLFCSIALPVSSQIIGPQPELPRLPPSDKKSASAESSVAPVVSATTAKTVKSEAEPSIGVSGAVVESVKRQIVAPSTVKSSVSVATTAPTRSLSAAPLEALAPRLRELKHLSKDQIAASVTDTFTAYVLRGDERTVVLDFPNTLAQARMFGRVILFVERDGTSKTRVMPVPEVKSWLRQNAQTLDGLTMGNNIRVGEFTRFFNTARHQGEPLTGEEQRLYDWLVQMQLMREEELGVAIVEPEVIVVSLPQASTVPGCNSCGVTLAQRKVVTEHELSHARFATDIPYQNYVNWFWMHGMNSGTRSKFTQFFRKRGYDATIRELLANEMQAFLMHTPDPAMFNASAVGITEAELTDLRDQFQAGLFPKQAATAGKLYQLD
ncbi:MAG: hypothetical protein V4805_00635 [Pseudomonadota bacterium]